MPSRLELHRSGRSGLLAALGAFAMLTCVQPAQAASDGSVTEEQVATAVKQLKVDPNLATDQSQRVLRWKDSDKPAKRSPPLGWLKGLLAWLTQTSRFIVWLAVATLAALLVVFVMRFIRARGPNVALARFEAPTHVRDLDIRPESLPDDIGGAALSAWERGDHRAALSLLYRGLLSRLVHVHALPIRQATTEGDCIELAKHHLRSESSNYVSRLVRVWQQAVYGNHEPLTDVVRELCAGFSAALAPEHPTAGAAP